MNNKDKMNSYIAQYLSRYGYIHANRNELLTKYNAEASPKFSYIWLLVLVVIGLCGYACQ